MQYVQKDQSYGSVYFPKIELDKTVKGILLDIDNTIYAYDECHRIAMLAVKNKINEIKKITDKEFSQVYKMARKRVNIDLNTQGASHSRILYFQKLLEKILGKTDFKLTLELEEVYWNTFLDEMKLLDNVYEFLEECQKNRIEICVITDLTVGIQIRKILKLKINNFIDFLVTSEEAGVEKPHPYIFKLCLEKLNLKANEVIVIGDNFKKDIMGAELLGINYIHVGVEE